jgi:hypothetical protein
VADETAQPGTLPRASDFYVEATRELAAAIRDLAGAIRESASFAGEIEWVPCDDSDNDGDNGGRATESGPCVQTRSNQFTAESADAEPEGAGDTTNGSTGEAAEDGARADLQLVPIQAVGHGDISNPDAEPSGLCRPGGCRCEDADEGVGRHARREPVIALVDQAQCCRTVPTSAR